MCEKYIRKEFRLEKEYIDIINNIMDKENLKTEKDVIKFLLNQYNEKGNFITNNIIENIADEVCFKIKDELTKIRVGVKVAEHNSIILKDVVNSFLMNNSNMINLVMYSDDENMKHPVIDQCEQHLAEKIAKAKMYKDTKR